MSRGAETDAMASKIMRSGGGGGGIYKFNWSGKGHHMAWSVQVLSSKWLWGGIKKCEFNTCVLCVIEVWY